MCICMCMYVYACPLYTHVMVEDSENYVLNIYRYIYI